MISYWWNWKAALSSAIVRAAVFFVTNLVAGANAAIAAAVIEFGYRAVASGFYGAIIQALCGIQPKWAAHTLVMICLPVTAHCLEFLVHDMFGTPWVWLSVAASLAMTAFSTSFNYFAMRRGALRVGAGEESFASDLKRMPGLVRDFLACAVRQS